jgi:hypothetical protein
MSELYDAKGVKRDNAYVLLDDRIFDGFVNYFITLSLLTAIFCRREVRLNCSNGSPEVLIWGDLPDDIRTSLERNIRTALAVEGTRPLEDTDSSKTPGVHEFESIHFDYYVRNATGVRPFNQ